MVDRMERWKNKNNEMKERKPDVDRKEDTKGMPSTAYTRYTKTIHGPKMEGDGNPVL
jgi:hypothetical protein